MLRRFCLYGFLKNQRYFEPFLVLALLQKGLDFAWIGLLIGFGAICVNALEIPTGAVADLLGRRRAMIGSHLAYIGSFVLFGLASHVAWLFGAMFLFGLGEAFRTGTHKAIIFAWLAEQGRSDEKTTVYGYTRSWSQIGSAVSVVLAAAIVIGLHNYRWVFWLSILPYTANLVNFLGYKRSLDGRRRRPSFRRLAHTLWQGVRLSLGRGPLRRLLAEAMAFEGAYATAKAYLQPVVRAAALATPVLVGLGDRQRTAVLVAIVYGSMALMNSRASRHSGSVLRRAGSEPRAARWLWWLNLGGYAALSAGLVLAWWWPIGTAVGIVAFLLLGVLQNTWRPLMVARVADRADKDRLATILSIESQSKSLFVAIAAPLVGLAVDAMGGDGRFLPAGLLGLALAAGALGLTRTGRRGGQQANAAAKHADNP